MVAIVNLKTFGDTRVYSQLDEQRKRATSLHNERVRENLEIVKRLIDCAVFLGQQELLLKGHNKGFAKSGELLGTTFHAVRI